MHFAYIHRYYHLSKLREVFSERIWNFFIQIFFFVFLSLAIRPPIRRNRNQYLLNSRTLRDKLSHSAFIILMWEEISQSRFFLLTKLPPKGWTCLFTRNVFLEHIYQNMMKLHQVVVFDVLSNFGIFVHILFYKWLPKEALKISAG